MTSLEIAERKVLIEKLLRSTNVATIYVLIRAKKGKNVSTRLEEMFKCALFDRLRVERPDFKRCVNVVAGDCTQENLGLTPEYQEELISKTNIVFHVAATVDFNENIKTAYDINVKGTKVLLEFCKKFKHLMSVVHTSTAYVYCHLDALDEVIYDHPLHYERADSMLEKLSLEEAHRLTPSIVNKWINTYTFTKAMTESMIKEISDGLPIGIFRPAIVTSSYKDPVESWVDSFAAFGFTAFFSLGFLRVLLYKEGSNMECVPVDLVTSAMIACAWDIPHKDPIPVYNYVSSIDNPTSFTDFFKILRPQMHRYPLRRPMNNIRMNRTKIPWTKGTKYIRFTLDEDLNFNEHEQEESRTTCTHYRTEEANRPTDNDIRRIARRWRKTSQKNIRRPQTLQNITIRPILKAPWHHTNEQLHNDIKFPTIEEHIRKLTENTEENMKTQLNPLIRRTMD
ncbi:hypothetical protein GEV33_005189 [Tenebrio molitor]|uniref:Fatty acyl-CoA reductase n=1 Tax=Tenebrio molitor TaxID=7067 RepID=A0A8J6HNT9_TENMO|nr:hypothetical protein GEV33_005189 [Tenebrio molitor]